MLNFFKELFNDTLNIMEPSQDKSDHKLKVAACALLLEIAGADDNFESAERNKIIDIMIDKFNLNKNEVNNIINESESTIDKSVSLYEFTDILNKQLTNNQKYEILKNLWHIAFADGNLDTYEDHYIKRISNNLHMYNKDRIAAKMEVKSELGL